MFSRDALDSLMDKAQRSVHRSRQVKIYATKICVRKIISGPILESKNMCAIFQKKGKKGQNILKFVQKCVKFEFFLKKGNLMCATIAQMKQLEYTLDMDNCKKFLERSVNERNRYLAKNKLCFGYYDLTSNNHSARACTKRIIS